MTEKIYRTTNKIMLGTVLLQGLGGKIVTMKYVYYTS